MTANDVIRLAWTAGMGVSVLAALWLLFEVLIDVYAISASERTVGLSMFQRYTESEVWIVGLTACALMAFFLAGLSSLLMLTMMTLLLLIVGGATVAIIPIYLHVRRRQIMNAVRLNRKPK